MVKVGIIGLGFMGRMHYEVYKKHLGARVVAIADYRKARRNGNWQDVGGNIANKSRKGENLTGISTYAKPEALLADPQVEMVDICLPTDLHAQVAIAALQAGKHVLLEKPMTLNSRQGQAIVKEAARAKKYFMVAHCIRFWPEYQVARELVRSRKYGRVKEAFFRRVVSPPTYGDKNWYFDSARSGAAQLDLHIHDVDYMLYLLGKPTSLYAWGSKGPSGGIDTVHCLYRYPAGVNVTIVGGWSYHGTFPFNMEFCIRCSKATMVYNLADGKSLTVYTHNGQEIKPPLPEGDGYSREIDYFLACIEQKVRPKIVTASSSLQTIKMIERELRGVTPDRTVKITRHPQLPAPEQSYFALVVGCVCCVVDSASAGQAILSRYVAR